MKYFIIPVLLLLAASSFGQSWSALRDEFRSLYAKSDFIRAIPVAQKAIVAAKSEFGIQNRNYANSVNNLAIVYTMMNRHAEAEPLFVEANRLWKSIPGDNRTDYATGLNNLAALYKNMARFRQAESLFLESLALHEQLTGKHSQEYVNTLTNLGSVYNDLGAYAKAELVDMEAIRLWRAIGEQKNPAYSGSLNNLANVYQKMGFYEKAEKQMLLALGETQKYLGKAHPLYTTILNNLGVLYDEMGQYDKAEKLLLEAVQLTGKQWGKEHTDYANHLSNLGALYEHLGQYEKAATVYAQAIAIREKVLGRTHPEYAASLNLLGGLLVKIHQYEKAEKLKTASIAIFRKVYGEKHPYYITVIADLANLYYETKQFGKAESLYLQVKEYRKRELGIRHPQYAATLMDLASLYFEKGQYEQSAVLLNEASDIHKSVLGEDHIVYANGIYNKALLSAITGNNKKSVEYILLNNRLVMQNILRNSGFLSEKEKRNFLETSTNRFDFPNSLLYRMYSGSESRLLAVHNFKQLLTLKSLVLSDSKNMLQSLRNSKDSSTRKLFDSWMVSRNILSRQYSLPSGNRMKDLKELEVQSEKLEKELNDRSPAFQQRQKLLQVSLKEMQQKLDKDEVALEFVRFKVYRKGWTDSVMYAAYVFSKADTVPAFVPLFEEGRLLSLLMRSGSTPTERANMLYEEDILQLNDQPSMGDSLYQLIWRPLEPFLQGVKKIAYSPSGQLYTVAIHAIPDGNGKLLMDRYMFRQYTNTREIVSRGTKNQGNAAASLAAFGNARFTMDSMELVKNKTSRASSSVSGALAASRGGNNAAWVELPATSEEIKEIGELFTGHQKKTNVFTREMCSEENLKALDGRSPQILHIATHGFFLPPPEQKKEMNFSGKSAYSVAEDPLLRNGIVMAGGNYAWAGNKYVEGVEDGICTAYEIAQLDLSQTKLVVLSACETALGDIKGSEGVFGLQRAFKMAGVDQLLVSLWQVPDRETSELMITFYDYLLNGHTVNESFGLAQSDMRKKYKPVSWAAFVLVE